MPNDWCSSDIAAIIERHYAPAIAARDKRIAELEEETIGFKALLACLDIGDELKKCGFDIEEWKRNQKKGKP
jgi:hypothetical protein